MNHYSDSYSRCQLTICECDLRLIFVRPFGVSARLGISEYQAATPMFKILGRHPPVAADQGDSIHQGVLQLVAVSLFTRLCRELTLCQHRQRNRSHHALIHSHNRCYVNQL